MIRFKRKRQLLKEKDILLKKYILENKKLKLELEKYKKEAYTDSLTQLSNRRSLENMHDFDAVILGDIDHFKIINDKYGHDFGDRVLIEIGRILKKYIRDTDLACRWGGEEFVILLKNCNTEDAYNKATILRNEIVKLSEKYGFRITMSFGISNMEGKTMENAIKEADKAMYKSKTDGRNRVTIYE